MLERFQSHENIDIYNETDKIVNKYFVDTGLEPEEEQQQTGTFNI